MKVLLTGATGFVGRKVLKRILDFCDAKEVIVLSAQDSISIDGIKTIPSRNYEFDEDYLCEMGCDAEVIIHLGAFIPKDRKDADSIIETTENIRCTEKLLCALKKNAKVKRIVFSSTVDVYSETEATLSENALTYPSTMYGWSKLYCEKMIMSFASQMGIQAEILRLGHVFGEGEEKFKKVMPIMIQSVLQGKDITIYGDGQALRTFIYIDDVAEAIVNSAQREESETINVVGNEAITINELAELIVEYADKRVRINHIPADAHNRNLCFDNSKLMSTLLNQLTPFKEGLKKEIEYMKSRYQ